MPLKLNILWIVLLAVLVAGCSTVTVETPTVTEVRLPSPKPLAMSSVAIDTNALIETAVVTNLPPIPTLPVTPLVALPVMTGAGPTNAAILTPSVVPANGWLPLQNWCQSNSLGNMQKIGSGQYAVVTRAGTLSVLLGSQMAHWDGTAIWLGFAPRIVGGQVCLHALDAQKTLDPLLHRAPRAAKQGRVLVIDPGHGGSDGGTVGSNKKHLEKNFALDWALRIQALLRTNGWNVFLTRSADVDLALTNRVAFADQVGADLFVSLHFNGLNAAASHSGVETFCLTPTGLPSSVTRGYEDNVRLEFPNNSYDRDNLQYAYRLHREILAATHATDGGLRHARFMGVLRGQHRPAVLIEGGFLSNTEEARRVATPAYRQKLAEAVARALTEQ